MVSVAVQNDLRKIDGQSGWLRFPDVFDQHDHILRRATWLNAAPASYERRAAGDLVSKKRQFKGAGIEARWSLGTQHQSAAMNGAASPWGALGRSLSGRRQTRRGQRRRILLDDLLL